MPVHIFFGLAGFVAGVTSALIGLTEKAIWRLGAYVFLFFNYLLHNTLEIKLLI